MPLICFRQIDVNEVTDVIGVTLGFLTSLGLLYGVEYLIGTFDSGTSNNETQYMLGDSTHVSINGMYQSTSVDEGEWEQESVQKASASISDPNHREKLRELIKTIFDSIILLEKRAKSLSKTNASLSEIEEITEEIDREIHNTHYSLDRARRLFQGGSGKYSPENAFASNDFGREKRKLISARLKELKSIVSNLLEQLKGDCNDESSVRKIYDDMEQADDKISKIHESVEYKWRRARPFPPVPVGSKLPMGMMIPIFIDGIMDGFLVGVTCSISKKAGIVLALANCIEMSLLGMALSARVVKCTGSPLLFRYAAISTPPLCMIGGAVVGCFLGDISQSDPIMFVAFVSFGIVALLYLVCNELIIEAREAQDGKNMWWISVNIFVGVYAVLMMNTFLPKD